MYSRECHVWCLCHHASILSQKLPKNCFGLKSILPFVTGRFRPKLHLSWVKGWECQVWCFRHLAPVGGEIWTKNYAASRLNCPSLPTAYGQMATDRGAWEASVRCHFPITPLLCEARSRRKTVSVSRVTCPSLHIDFDQTCTDSRACPVNVKCHISVTPLQCEVMYGRKILSTSRVKCPSLAAVWNKLVPIVTRWHGSARSEVLVTLMPHEVW
jgi:hypothetical protein